MAKTTNAKFILCDMATRQMVLVDYDSRDFGAWRHNKLSEARARGHLKMTNEHGEESYLFVGPGMILTFLTHEQLDEKQAQAEAQARRAQLLQMPQGPRG